MRRFRNTISVVVIAAILLACSAFSSSSLELVMCEGNTIEIVIEKNNRLLIEATKPLTRKYVLGDTLSIEASLAPRQSRWYGVLGAYRASEISNAHLVLQEAVQHFSSESEAIEWMHLQSRNMPRRTMYYTDSGLFVSWEYQKSQTEGASPESALSIDIFQILVNLEPPKDLKGGSHLIAFNADNRSCDVTRLEPGFMPGIEATIDGREYSGRVIDIMQEKGYSPRDVELLITNSNESINKGGYITYMNTAFSIPNHVTIDESGRVVDIQ